MTDLHKHYAERIESLKKLTRLSADWGAWNHLSEEDFWTFIRRARYAETAKLVYSDQDRGCLRATWSDMKGQRLALAFLGDGRVRFSYGAYDILPDTADSNRRNHASGVAQIETIANIVSTFGLDSLVGADTLQNQKAKDEDDGSWGTVFIDDTPYQVDYGYPWTALDLLLRADRRPDEYKIRSKPRQPEDEDSGRLWLRPFQRVNIQAPYRFETIYYSYWLIGSSASPTNPHDVKNRGEGAARGRAILIDDQRYLVTPDVASTAADVLAFVNKNADEHTLRIHWYNGKEKAVIQALAPTDRVWVCMRGVCKFSTVAKEDGPTA